jgi:uncharacterized protein
MRPSSFVLNTIAPEPLQATMVCADTLSGQVALLPAALQAALNGEEEGRLSSRDRAHLALLEQRGLVVPVGAAGLAADRDRLQGWLGQAARSCYQFTICPTLDCNLRCGYCYQEGIARGRVMSAETARQAVAWFEECVVRERRPLVIFGLYGGEPLLRPAVICEAARLLATACARLGMPVALRILTNGTLLSPGILREIGSCLRPLWIEAQVTLDGPRDLHDRRRPQATGGGSFDAILGNLLALGAEHPGLALTIRVNVDRGNAGQALELARVLADCRARLPAGARLRFALTRGCSPCDPWTLEGKDAAQTLSALWAGARALGWESAAHPLRYGPCGEYLGNAVIVDPEGYVYRCEGMVGRWELAVGHVGEKATLALGDPETLSAHWEACLGRCPVVPLCLGGCRLRAFMRHGDWRVRACERATLQAVAEACLRAGWPEHGRGPRSAAQGAMPYA